MGNKRIEKKKAKLREAKLYQAVPAKKEKKAIEPIHKPEPVPAAQEAKAQTGTKTLKPSIFLQYGKHQTERTALLNAVKQWWKEQGYLVRDLKEVNLYAKPAEGTVYFTINGSIQGDLPIPFMPL